MDNTNDLPNEFREIGNYYKHIENGGFYCSVEKNFATEEVRIRFKFQYYDFPSMETIVNFENGFRSFEAKDLFELGEMFQAASAWTLDSKKK
jgi:hypothetical protein